jgi:archaellum component FlaC
MARWLSDHPFELVWVTYTLAPLVIRYILHPHPDGGLFRFVSRSSLSADRRPAPPARTSNVQEINVRLAEMSSEASRWYRALGHKGLLHDRSMIHVLTHVTVLAGWCAKSFENLKDQIRDMNQRITGQQTTLLGEQARITMLYTAMEPLKNEFSASRSILAIVQSHISAVKGGLDRLQDTFGHLKSRFDGLQGRLTTSDNRIDELELQIQALRSSLESFRQGIHSAGLAQKESVQACLSPIENEVRNSQILAKAPPPASGTVYTHRSVRSTSAPESPVMSEVSQGVKRLLEQQHLYKKKLDEQMCQLDDQIAGLERRMTAEQVSLRTGEEAVQARLDALAVSNEASQVLKEAKAFVREKFKKIVDASKLKFEEHGNRIAALEKDVYKPSLAPPMGERLEVLEYDVQKLTGKEMESAIQLCTALENLNVLQERMDNLRLDVKNAYKKVSTPEADRKSLYAHDSAVQQLTTRLEMLEHDSLSHMDTMDHFQKRFEQVQLDCRQFLEKTQQLTGLEGPRLNDMERVLQKATEIFAIGLVQIKKQVEYLEQEFEGVGNEVGERLANYLDLADSERDRNAPSASHSICSVEAVHNHVYQSPRTAMQPPRPSDPEFVSDSSTFPGGNSGIVDHRTIQEQGLAPLDTFSTSSTRNVSLEQIQRAFILLTDRCRTLEMKLERFESLSDARLGNLQRDEVAQQGIADLDRRVRLLEVELPNGRLGHNMATTQSSNPPAWLQETALVQSSASALLTTRSTLEPFSADVLSSTDREEIAGRLRESDQSKPINPIPALPTFSSLASRESIQASVRPYEKTTPSASFQLALVQASSIWSPPSAEFGPTSALEGKLERFEKGVNQQMSQLRANLERTMTSLQDLTLLIASAYGPVLSGDQKATVLEILEPASDPSDQTSTASKETILTPSFNDFKASLAALKDNFERMDLIVKQDTQKLVSLQRQLDETAMTTPASQINHLRENVGYLTNRINTLEHNLHWKGVI